MVVVESGPLVPGACLVTKQPDGPLIDLLRDFDYIDHAPGGRMYVGWTAVRDMARMFAEAGHPVTDAPERDLQAELDQAHAEIARLEAEVEELETFAQSVYVLKQKGYSAQKKPGRPPKKKEPVPSGS